MENGETHFLIYAGQSPGGSRESNLSPHRIVSDLHSLETTKELPYELKQEDSRQ